MFQRSAGVLMNISSLPSPYGIGDFGAGGRQFADLLAKMHMKWWQLLPLCPVGSGDSPYSSFSVFALNPLYIDPDGLADEGLITREEAESARYEGSPHSVDYAFAREAKERLLRLAFSRSDRTQAQAFCAAQAGWLPAYARFMAGKQANAGLPCWEWTQPGDGEEEAYYQFEQACLFRQWEKLKAYANGRGVSILGDMPIYVSRDSADFWSKPELFQTDEQGNPAHVAGVPPDYFAADGQLWGNPLYNWEAMERDGYSWWLGRIGAALKLYDAVRIDHFRGFHRYWAVPAQAETAREGVWEAGPGMKLFELVEKTFHAPKIVAEDLGTWDEALAQFLRQAGYPGMKVMQFGFGSYDSGHAPYRYTPNCVAYTGTHDNDTMLGWLWAIPMEEKKRLLQYCRYFGDNWGEGGEKSEVIRAVVATLWASAAGLAMIPVQDLCGFGTDTRMNIPGKAEGNWRFRITKEAMERIDVDFYRQLNLIYGRG